MAAIKHTDGKSIRLYLESITNADTIYITDSGEQIKVDNVELVWEGSQYYLICNDYVTNEKTSTESLSAALKVRNLDDCLPMTITTATATE